MTGASTQAEREQRRATWSVRIGWVLLAILLLTLFLGVGLPAYLRARCGAQGLLSQTVLKNLCGTVYEEIDITGTLPPRLALVFVQHGPLPIDEYEPCLPRVETRIGPFELAKVYQGEQPFHDFKEYAEKHPAEGEWEQIGRFMISREIAAYKTFRPDVIIGFQLGDYGMMKDGLSGGDPNRRISVGIASAAMHTGSYVIGGEWDDDFEEIIDADRLAREELGLSEPPEYERVIRNFMAEQRGK